MQPREILFSARRVAAKQKQSLLLVLELLVLEPIQLSRSGPIELAAALAAILYCIFTKPTRLMLLLYTVTFVAGIHAVALTLAFFGSRSSTAPSADFSPFLTARSLSIFGLVVSLVYPIYFVAKGRYARQYISVGG